MNGFVSCLLVILAGQTAAQSVSDGPIVEVFETRLPPYSASLASINSEGATLRYPDGQRLVALDQLRRLRFGFAANIDSSPGLADAVEVGLTDGSQFLCQSLQYNGTSFDCELVDATKLKLNARSVAYCRLQSLSDLQRPQWQAVVSSRISKDIMVLLRSTEALDKVEGMIQSIDAKNVKFEFEGQAIDAPRSKLAGLRFFSKGAADTQGKVLAMARGQSGSQWMISSLNYEKNAPFVKATLVCSSELQLKLASLSELDFSFGSLRFLAELQPLERTSDWRANLPVDLPELKELFGPQALPQSDDPTEISGPGLQFLGAGTIVYRVPDGFQRLQGFVELSPQGQQYVACRVSVLLEDKVLFDKQLSETRAPQEIDLVVEAGQRLKLVVSTESTRPVGNLVLWKHVRFVK